MIIPKSMIDASINSKKAAIEARNMAMFEAIKSKVGDMQKLPAHIAEIVETFRYVYHNDKEIGKKFWSAICEEDKKFGLDFCNAISERTGEACGVRPHYSVKENHFTYLYVTAKRVLFIPTRVNADKLCDQLLELSDLDKLPEDKYELMLNSMALMIESIPAYKERLATKLKELLNK